MGPKHEQPHSGLQQRVALVDGDPAHQRRVSQILKTVDASIVPLSSFDEVEDGAFDVVVVNYDALDADAQRRLAEDFAPRIRSSRVLVLTTLNAPDDYARLFHARSLMNLLARKDQIDAEELIVTVQKLLRRDIFGMEKYFVWGVEPIVLTITRSGQKTVALQRTEDFAKHISISPRVANLLATVVDEFVTNALYNAPVDAEGRHRFAHLARTQEAVLSPGEEVVIKLSSDGRKVGVSIADPFGSLASKRVVDYLAKCFTQKGEQVDEKAGGAGLGLYYIFDAVTHFVVNIAPGKRTEMIGFIDVETSFRKLRAAGKSFNIFVTEAA